VSNIGYLIVVVILVSRGLKCNTMEMLTVLISLYQVLCNQLEAEEEILTLQDIYQNYETLCDVVDESIDFGIPQQVHFNSKPFKHKEPMKTLPSIGCSILHSPAIVYHHEVMYFDFAEQVEMKILKGSTSSVVFSRIDGKIAIHAMISDGYETKFEFNRRYYDLLEQPLLNENDQVTIWKGSKRRITCRDSSDAIYALILPDYEFNWATYHLENVKSLQRPYIDVEIKNEGCDFFITINPLFNVRNFSMQNVHVRLSRLELSQVKCISHGSLEMRDDILVWCIGDDPFGSISCQFVTCEKPIDSFQFLQVSCDILFTASGIRLASAKSIHRHHQDSIQYFERYRTECKFIYKVAL